MGKTKPRYCIKSGCYNEALDLSNYCFVHNPNSTYSKHSGLRKKAAAKAAPKKYAKKSVIKRPFKKRKKLVHKKPVVRKSQAKSKSKKGMRKL